jgi:hypothetical protein
LLSGRKGGWTSFFPWFLDRIATHILAFEGDSRVVWFEGNYQEYEAGPQTSTRRDRSWYASCGGPRRRWGVSRLTDREI